MKLMSDDYSIRGIREEDLKMLLSWRNSERIRSVMLTDHEITWEEHYNWFKRNEHNEPPRNLIFEYKGPPIGYIGYTEYDIEQKTCSPGCYLGDIEMAPIDAGMILFITTMDYAFDALQMQTLKTEVFKKNRKAMKIDKLLGFKIVGEKVVTKDKVLEICYNMELLAADWETKKFTFYEDTDDKNREV